jgi:hypothetical protein
MSAIPRHRIAEAMGRFALRDIAANGSAAPGAFVPTERAGISPPGWLAQAGCAVRP